MKKGILILSLFITYSLTADEPQKCPIEYSEDYTFIDGENVLTLRSGNESILMRYGYASSFSEGLAKVMINGKYGYIDKTVKMVIKHQFDAAWDFSEGLAPVMIDGKWGFIKLPTCK